MLKQDEIIEMARQAGAAVGKLTPDGPNIAFTQCLDIYAFAKLVAAKEREACAKVCESHKSENFPLVHNNAVVGCAFAIRARGEK